MTDAILRSSYNISTSMFVPFSTPSGAVRLLGSEASAFAIDATTYSSVAPALYTGGPVGGTVAVVDAGTPANNIANVALDASNVSNASTSPKFVLSDVAGSPRWAPHNLQRNTIITAGSSIGGGTATAGFADPAGGATATKLTGSGTDWAWDLASNFPCGTQTMTTSMWLRADANQNFAVQIFGAGIQGPTFSITTSWVRYQSAIIIIPNAGLANIRLGGGGTTFAGQNVYIYGVQVNRGPTALPFVGVTSGTERIGIPLGYDDADNKFGILAEPAATNLCLQSDDLTQAAWTKTNLTTAYTATAPEGSINQASTITASAANATALQAITSAVNDRVTSVWIKRRTGSGNIDLTQDNGGTWTTQAVTSTWTRFKLSFVNSTNPTIGIRIVTNTDAVDVWGFQHEVGRVVTSTIPTTQASTVTRAADVISAVDSTFPGSDTNVTVYLDYKPLNVNSGSRYGWAYWKDASNFISLLDSTADPIMGNTQAATPDVSTDLGTLVAGTRTQISIAAKGNNFNGSQDGAVVSSDVTATLTTGYTTLYLGTFGTTGSELNGFIYRMVFVPYQRQTVNGDLPSWRYNF